jgi:protein TonB
VFDTLLASNLGSGPWVRPAAAAALLHLGVILGAVTATETSPNSSAVARDTIRLEIGRPASPQRKSIPQAAPPSPHSIIPAPPPLNLRPETPRLDPPPVSLNIPLDPEALSKAASVHDSGLPSSAVERPGSVFPVAQVDQPPELAHYLHPRYPEALRQAGVSGAVQLEYVISTEGRVDPGSIRVLQSRHAAFTAAATEAVRGARFKPARRSGRPVAVLVQQTIRFLNR